MNTAQIVAIVNWIKEHPDHFPVEDDKPSAIWVEFYREPEQLNEYELFAEMKMDGPAILDGCRHKFRKGPSRGSICSRREDAASVYCPFHSHVIFSSKVYNHIKDKQNEINNLYESKYQANKTERQPPTVNIERIKFNTYREVDHNLALELEGVGIRCVGVYNPDMTINRSPLPAHLAAICDNLGFHHK